MLLDEFESRMDQFFKENSKESLLKEFHEYCKQFEESDMIDALDSERDSYELYTRRECERIARDKSVEYVFSEGQYYLSNQTQGPFTLYELHDILIEISDECEHQWISAKNEVVNDGYMCTDCGKLKLEEMEEVINEKTN